MILFASAFVSDPKILGHIKKQGPLAKDLKQRGPKLVNLVCGNYYIINQEDFIFDCHHRMKDSFTPLIDQIWILPMYKFMLSYYQVITRTPCRITPYVWNTDIINTYNQQEKLQPAYRAKNPKQINFMILEPNMSIHKTAMIPLTIIEKFYRNHKELVNQVMVFSAIEKEGFKTFLSNLDITQDKKVKLYHRMKLMNVLDQIQNQGEYMTIIVTHQELNVLNFLHLELFSLGFPVVHNCPPYQECGYYYPNIDIDMGYQAITQAVRFHHPNIEKYLEYGKKIIDRYDYHNPEVIAEYKKAVEELQIEIKE